MLFVIEEKGWKTVYDELKNISYIFYINNTSEKIHMCNISDRKKVDDNGYPRYRAQYGNCLIALRNQKITDKLYLMKEETFNRVKKKFWQLDRYLMKDFFDRYADRIVAR